MITIEFEEDELSRIYTETAIGGPTFNTAVTGNPPGTQQRVVNRYDAVRRYQINFALKPDERPQMEEFFITKFGAGIGFLFYPPSDRAFLGDVIGVGDSTTRIFYLQRNYASRSRFIQRRIVKPIEDTLTVTVDNQKVKYYAVDGVTLLTPPGAETILANPVYVDWTTGIITFDNPPAAGAVIRAARGEYNVPVVFEDDNFEAADHTTIHEWDSVWVQEILPSALGIDDLTDPAIALRVTSPRSRAAVGSTFDVSFTGSGVTKVYLYINGVYDSYSTGVGNVFAFTGRTNPATAAGVFRVVGIGTGAAGAFTLAGVDLESTLPAGTAPLSMWTKRIEGGDPSSTYLTGISGGTP